MPNIDFKELALETIQSQYGASLRIRALIEAFAARIDPNADIDLFYKKIMDLDTAEGIGLDIWGVIVGVNRILEVPSDDIFGYYGSGLQPYNQGHFYGGDSSITNYYTLTDNAFRKLIYFKALENIIPTDAASINAALAFLFDGRPASVIEVGVMKIRYVFGFELEPFEISVLKKYIFRPAGVGFEWYQVPMDKVFGFDGSGCVGFDNGVFNPFEIVQQ